MRQTACETEFLGDHDVGNLRFFCTVRRGVRLITILLLLKGGGACCCSSCVCVYFFILCLLLSPILPAEAVFGESNFFLYIKKARVHLVCVGA